MKKIEELLSELCPNGVKYETLSDICKIYDGTHSTPNYRDSGVKFVSVENISDLYSSNKYISEEDFEKYKIKPQIDDILMTRIGSIGVCTVVDRDEPLAYYVSLALLRPDTNIILSRYLKYAIESVHGRKELRKRTLVNAVPIKINKDDIGKIQLPVPPIAVQLEIIKAIDELSKLHNSMLRELQGELDARRIQHDYYHRIIMEYTKDVPRIRLGDVGPVCMCKRVLKAQTNTEGGIPFYKIGTFGKSANAYISEDLFEEYKAKYNYPRKGDILISAAGTIGRTVVFDGEPAYFQDSNIVWIDNDESKILNSYLQYCYGMNPWKVSGGGTIARLYNDNIANAEIPMPTIEEQKKIINKLEKESLAFTEIIDLISQEIEARKKQYEYYKDKLMTFNAAN